MRKVFLWAAGVLLLSGCGIDDIGNTTDTNGKSAAITITLDAGSRASIVVNEYPVISAHFDLYGPAGLVASEQWTNGAPSTFTYQNAVEGDYSISLEEQDSSGASDAVSNCFTVRAGYNYSICMTLGQNISIHVGGTPGTNGTTTTTTTVPSYYTNTNFVYPTTTTTTTVPSYYTNTNFVYPTTTTTTTVPSYYTNTNV